MHETPREDLVKYVRSEVRTRCEHDNPQKERVDQVQYEVRTGRVFRIEVI